MPSVGKSDKWFVRVDGPQEFLLEKCCLLAIQCIQLISVFHKGQKGENPHCHMLVHTQGELQKQSWDVKLKKLFSVSKDQYSSKHWDGRLIEEGAGTYLFHESVESPILCKKGIKEEEIQRLKELSLIVNKVVEANRQKAETKIPAKVIEKWNNDNKPEWHDKQIVRIICEMAQQGECYLPKTDWQWKAYIEEIKLKMCITPADFDNFVSGTYQRLFCR